jgi:hypothetical protein
MGLKDDAERLLRYMNEKQDPHGRGRGIFEGPPLMGALHMKPQDVNDAVDLLEENGYVETGRYLGTTPFVFRDVQLTPQGRLEAERLEAEELEAEKASPAPPAPTRGPILWVRHTASGRRIGRASNATAPIVSGSS